MTARGRFFLWVVLHIFARILNSQDKIIRDLTQNLRVPTKTSLQYHVPTKTSLQYHVWSFVVSEISCSFKTHSSITEAWQGGRNRHCFNEVFPQRKCSCNQQVGIFFCLVTEPYIILLVKSSHASSVSRDLLVGHRGSRCCAEIVLYLTAPSPTALPSA